MIKASGRTRGKQGQSVPDERTVSVTAMAATTNDTGAATGQTYDEPKHVTQGAPSIANHRSATAGNNNNDDDVHKDEAHVVRRRNNEGDDDEDDYVASLRLKLKRLEAQNEKQELQAAIAKEEQKLQGAGVARPSPEAIEAYGVPSLVTYHAKNRRESRRWLEQVASHMDLTGMRESKSEQHCISWAAESFRKRAQINWLAVLEDGTQPKTWKAFEAWVLDSAEDPAKSGQDAAMKFESARQRQGQPVKEFFDYIDGLLQALAEPMPEALEVQLVLFKLLPVLRDEVIRLRPIPASRKEFREDAVRLEALMTLPEKSSAPGHGAPKSNNSGTKRKNGELRSKESKRSRNDAPLPRLPDAEYKKRRDNRLCLRCGRSGHQVSECRNPANTKDTTKSASGKKS